MDEAVARRGQSGAQPVAIDAGGAAGFPVGVDQRSGAARVTAGELEQHTGEFMGIPPSGKSINVAAIGISRIADGKSVEYWETFDALGMMQQIGAIPASQ